MRAPPTKWGGARRAQIKSTTMELTINTKDAEWLDAARDNFQTALERSDIGMAKAVIADTFDAGFPVAARVMVIALRNSTSV